MLLASLRIIFAALIAGFFLALVWSVWAVQITERENGVWKGRDIEARGAVGLVLFSAFFLLPVVWFLFRWIKDLAVQERMARWARQNQRPAHLATWGFSTAETLALISDSRPANRDVLSLSLLELVSRGALDIQQPSAKVIRLMLRGAEPEMKRPPLRAIVGLIETPGTELSQLVSGLRSKYSSVEGFVSDAVQTPLVEDGLMVAANSWSFTQAGEATRKDAQARVASLFFRLRQDTPNATWVERDARKDFLAAVLALSVGGSVAGTHSGRETIDAAVAAAVVAEPGSDATLGRMLDLVLLDYDDRFRAIDSAVESSGGGGGGGDGDGDGGD